MADALELAAAGSAWDQATAGITGVDAELAKYRELFVLAIVAEAPLSELEQELEDAFAELDWQWPWFDKWYATFTEWGYYPYLWPALTPQPDELPHYSPEDLAVYKRAGMAPLMAHTAAMIFYRDRHISKAPMHQKWRLAHLNDPAEMRVATQKEIAIMSGDLSDMPPFFPGDRTSLKAQNPIGPKDDKRPEADAEGEGAPEMKVQAGLSGAQLPPSKPDTD